MERDVIKEHFKSILPNISDEKSEELLNLLETLGVLSMEDLDPELISFEDLRPCIPIVWARKLRRDWERKKGSQQTLPHLSVYQSTTSGPSVPNQTEVFTCGHSGQPITVSCYDASGSQADFIQIPDSSEHLDFKKITLLERLESDIKITPKERRSIVNDVCTLVTMKFGDGNPGRRVWRPVAKLLVEQYGYHFREVGCDGQVVDDGFLSLAQALEHRCENERRSRKRALVAEEAESPRPKASKSDDSGCVDWCYSALPEGVTEAAVEEIRINLCEIYKEDPSFWNDDEIAKKMNIGYSAQRKLIKEMDNTNVIKEMWPFLTESKHLLFHFERLTSVCGKEALINFINENVENCIRFFTVCGKRQMECLAVELEASEAVENEQSLKPYLIAVLNMVALSVGEDFSCIMVRMKETSDVDEIEAAVSTTTPTLVALGSSVHKAEKFFLLLDGKVFIEESDVVIAIALLFASYYVFNFKYNENVALTLEFIEKCIMKVNPTHGSKSPKKK